MDKSILGAKTIKQAMRLMKANVFTAPEMTEQVIKNTTKHKDLNAFVNLRDTSIMMKEAENA